MNKTQSLLTLMAAAISANPLKPPPLPEDRTYGAVPNPDTRSLREFSIKGQKIMAYSKIDAIKRLKHLKRK